MEVWLVAPTISLLRRDDAGETAHETCEINEIGNVA
jgi:hypothetical protein